MSDLTNGPSPGFWRMLRRTGGLLPVFLAVFMVIFSLISMNEMRKGLAFASRGVETTGEVIDRQQQRVRRDDRWQIDYYLTMRFEAVDEVVEVRQEVRQYVYDTSDIGSFRDVRYLPEAPRRVEFEIGETMRDGRTMRWVSLAIGIATLGVLWWKGSKAVDAIRARKFGAVEYVTVTGLREVKHKNSTAYALEWVDTEGNAGNSMTRGARAPFEAYPVGTQIELFRGVSRRMWWVGDVGPRKAATTVPSVGKR
ncbi:DUF3592 domain-containing protein [Tateyamaria sp.]|uniref:DUF3592 domain-containing protein n=1 Tax=Tateyamaria sp. TaxID=1929288 RepID=UPI0032DDF393